MLLFKEKDAAAKKKLPKKNPFCFERLYFTLLVVVVSVRKGNAIFSTFTDFLIFV